MTLDLEELADLGMVDFGKTIIMIMMRSSRTRHGLPVVLHGRSEPEKAIRISNAFEFQNQKAGLVRRGSILEH